MLAESNRLYALLYQEKQGLATVSTPSATQTDKLKYLLV